MKIYLAGPMRGYPKFNHPAFDAAAAFLRGLGHEVFSPADEDRADYGAGIVDDASAGDLAEIEGKGFDLRVALAKDLAWICANADALAVLDGWEQSMGARAEVAVAEALGIPVYAARTFRDAAS